MTDVTLQGGLVDTVDYDDDDDESEGAKSSNDGLKLSPSSISSQLTG